MRLSKVLCRSLVCSVQASPQVLHLNDSSSGISGSVGRTNADEQDGQWVPTATIRRVFPTAGTLFNQITRVAVIYRQAMTGAGATETPESFEMTREPASVALCVPDKRSHTQS